MIKNTLPLFFCFLLLISGCSLINQQSEITITISDSESSNSYQIPAGSTVSQALDYLGISLGTLDRTEPSLLSLLSEGETLRIIRVTEEFEIVESVLPFEQQTVKNESISEGQTILIQSGINGLQQTTYRIVKENGDETSRTVVKTEVIQQSKPEIVMIGVQSPYSAVSIQGTLAYISSSNAWVMENNTGNRRAVVTTGDLDGRIFSLSPDNKWLLFSRSIAVDNSEDINSLWIVDISQMDTEPIDTNIRNVVHYADWIPGKNQTFTYSTVEPRSVAPGWQANNDLQMYSFDENGKKVNNKIIVDTNSGGQYGWWGTIYKWSPEGSRLAFSRPDSIGLVDFSTGDLQTLLEFTPYQPQSDWAWVPSLMWSEDNKILYTIVDSSGSDINDEGRTFYNLSAILLDTGNIITVAENCGLFCYPVLSPIDASGRYLIGFLSSIIPEQSETSRYNLKVMDRDGSNQLKLYPGEGIQGLNPQQISWSPNSPSDEDTWIAFISQGNIMLANPSSSSIRQVSGDGSVTNLIWR